MIDTRDTDKVNEVLRKFPNLKIISRDRGIQYHNIDKRYVHIADRFHLIANLSEMMIEKIKNMLPRKIKINENTPEKSVQCQHQDETLIENKIDVMNLSPQKQEKLNLILEIQEYFKAGISIHQLAYHYGMNRNTIRKYIKLDNPDAVLQNVSRSETMLFLDTISEKIHVLCSEYHTVTQMTHLLQEEYRNQVN